MRPFPIEELVSHTGSRFAVVVAAAKRAQQIKEGAPPLVNLPTRNPLSIALYEIAAGLVEITDAPVVEEAAPAYVAEEGLGELAAPEVVESLIDNPAVIEPDGSEGFEDSYEADVDEAIAADLDEDTDEELDEEEEDDLEELELDEEEEEEEGLWEEE